MSEQEHLYVTVGLLFLDGWNRDALFVSASCFGRFVQTPGKALSGKLLLLVERGKAQLYLCFLLIGARCLCHVTIIAKRRSLEPIVVVIGQSGHRQGREKSVYTRN